MPDPIVPVFSLGHLRACLSEYLRAPSQWAPGKRRVLFGEPRPDLQNDLTHFVVRIGHYDRLRWIACEQKSTRGNRDNVYRRRYYALSHYTYVVASYAWATGAVTELSSHATLKEARAALSKISP